MMVGDCRMLGCLHSVFNEVEKNGFARRWTLVQRSVLRMKLECQAVIRNCDCELFTRNLHCDSQIWNHMMLARWEKVTLKKLKWGQKKSGESFLKIFHFHFLRQPHTTFETVFHFHFLESLIIPDSFHFRAIFTWTTIHNGCDCSACYWNFLSHSRFCLKKGC